jgi:hypothetical protein
LDPALYALSAYCSKNMKADERYFHRIHDAKAHVLGFLGVLAGFVEYSGILYL